MLIINGGIPRSGTVLVGNLVRLMLERRGIQWRRYNPQERRHLPEFLRVVQQPDFDGALIVHTHLIDPAICDQLGRRNDAVLIWNHRDPRDALVSLMKLHDLPLDRGLHAIRIYCAATEIARSASGCVRISYEQLTENLGQHITMLAKAFGFELETGEIEALIRQTSLSEHAAVMDSLKDGSLPGATTIHTKRRILREDPKTLVNDRHIQSGRSGRWREELSGAAQETATQHLSAWIKTFGYDVA